MSLYAALEGIEGTGKSTLVSGLAERFEADGHEVVVVREPGGTRVGESVRHIVLSSDFEVEPWTEALLFAAQRAQLAAEIIRPALARGALVLSDRTVYSSLAYQGVGRRLGLEDVRRVNQAGLGGTWPEVVLLLEIDPPLGLSRQSDPDRIGAEGLAFQASVADAFERLGDAEPDRFVRIDANRPPEAILADAHRAIEQRL